MIVAPVAGLGNRLYAFASAYELSKRCQRKLLVLWNNDDSFAVNMQDVLKIPKDIKVINVTESSFIRAPIRSIYSKLLFRTYKKTHAFYNTEDFMYLPRKERQKMFENMAVQNEKCYFRVWLSLIP